MPREWCSRRDQATPVIASPHAQTPRFASFAEEMRSSRLEEKGNLHPYIQTLTVADVDSCVALENAAFPEHERCSREKFIYRLNTSPEIALGLFSTSDDNGLASSSPTYPSARPPDSQNPSKKGVLIGHVIATKSSASRVTDASMDFPHDWQSNCSSTDTRGHQESGRSIVVHSVAIVPNFHGRGMGKMMLKSYVQRMETSGIGDRIILLAHDELIKFYENSGFRDQGQSEVKFGGGGWNDMSYEFSPQKGFTDREAV
ncbi:MAG: hypothetical protein Q9195_002200 [Heterodermia aff. obscurata]